MSIHILGLAGLIAIFLIGTLRPINIGVLALAMTFVVGLLGGAELRELSAGFPVDLLILLAGVTYLFGIAVNNGTISAIVDGATSLFRQNGALVPWVMFAVASLPAMAGALGSAGVAMIAPIALRLAQRYDIDRRMMGLMVIYGAGAGNFSPLNVLGALVAQTTRRAGLDLNVWALFAGNLVFNLALAGVAYALAGGFRARTTSVADEADKVTWRIDRVCTVVMLLSIAIAAFVFNINIGFLAFAAGALLQLVFAKSSGDPEKRIAWSVVLLVCGIVTYVAALQRYGTIDLVGNGIANLSSPMLAALLLCAIGAVTSAFASSAGILGALVPLAIPLMVAGAVDTTGMVIALSLSATVVDATPFSTVGALVVANAEESERPRVYRGLLAWGAAMVVLAPPITWLLFVMM